ncbi:MiaB/RimO family radical SAM methylthiotransferase, partial [Patescibacteria group bacterium]|nr:MiaB/RimO family radical SAM methylthiotransferase [Patescibacteria group bacterium]
TIGCQMNKSDSERIAGYLEKHGYKKSAERKKAGLVILVTCGVRQSAEDRIYGLVPKIKKENPKAKIILTGCLVNREDVKRRLNKYVDIWLPITEIFNFQFSIFNQFTNFQFSIKKQKEKISCGKDDYLSIKPKYSSKFSAFVPIGNGCNNFCSYCVVPYARGREVYRPAKDIINEVSDLVSKGYKEIILIAQNVNSYNSPFTPKNAKKRQNINFSKLLRLINDIPGDFWIRFFTSHPKDMSDELIKTIAGCGKVCRHIHLPAQAGDDKILKAMNRKYTVEFYKKLIGKIKKVLNFKFPILNFQKISNFQFPISKFNWEPPVAVTTDIIVGFPGETKKQFNNTVKLFKEVKFDMAYISRYSPRPGTAAEKLKDNISKIEKKKREELLMKILRKTALANNEKYIGKVVDVLVEGKNKRGEWYGKTETAKNVKFPMAPATRCATGQANDKTNLIGEFIDIKIIKARDFGLEGEVVKSE